MTKSLYQYTLQGTDIEELYRAAAEFESRVRALPGLQDVTSDLQISSPQVNLDIDRDKASALGVTAQQIEDALYDAYGQRQVSTIYTPTDEYWVIMELLPHYQRDPAALSMLYVRSAQRPAGAAERRGAADARRRAAHVTHLGQLPSVTISFNLKPGCRSATP